MNNKLIFIPILLILSSSLLFSDVNASQSVLSIVFGAFVAGLLLTFTPCVLPMIPILSSIIAGEGKDISKQKSVMLSLAYVLGTAVTYAIMGALAGATGEQLQVYFQSVWFISLISLMFVLMALSMFGLYNIQMPSFIQSRLDKSSHGIKGGSTPMVFLLGMISALILGACVSPVLISFLGVAISTGDATLGALTMFFMALGMGVPLILLGFGAGHILPKVGDWMDTIKYIFGVMLLAVAVYLFSTLNLLPSLLLWGVLFIELSIYLGATQSLEKSASGWHKLSKAIGTILLIWGFLLLVGAGYGEEDIFSPLPKTSTVTVSNKNVKSFEVVSMPFETIKSLDELESKKEVAKTEGKLVVIYFYTDWCTVCKKFKATTLIDIDVQKELRKDYIAIKVNMTDREDKAMQAIKKKFAIFGSPALVFLDRDGKELKDDNFYGYQDPEEFLDTLELVAEE